MGFTEGQVALQGYGAEPALDFGRECPATLGMICPKSQHKSLAQAGISPEALGRAASSQVRERRPLVREGRTLCMAAQDMC